MTCGIDRWVRLAVGLALLALVSVGPQAYLGLLGLIPLFIGLIGFFPLYRVVGATTCAVRRS